ncbi:MAG: asparagine synthase-related protein, partial [Gemmatimonadaceae bacterium]
IDQVYAPEFRAALGASDVIGELRASLSTRFFGWSPLNQAAYLEMTTVLSPYLLSSHGDRMTMAHGVEGRYPFLDHRLFEFASALPTGSHLRGLRDKEVLRRWASRILPKGMSVASRSAYSTADAQCFLLPTSPSWVGDHLTNEALRRVGIFSPGAVSGLKRRCLAGQTPTNGESQTLLGVLSTQLWYHEFVESSLLIPPLPVNDASISIIEDVADFSQRPSAVTSHADT